MVSETFFPIHIQHFMSDSNSENNNLQGLENSWMDIWGWVRNFALLIAHPPQNHSWIFETLWVIIFLVRVTHKMLNVNWEKIHFNNFISHLSWLKKLCPTHTHPQISIHEFSKPCKLLFSELESLIKCWMWIGKKFTQ